MTFGFRNMHPISCLQVFAPNSSPSAAGGAGRSHRAWVPQPWVWGVRRRGAALGLCRALARAFLSPAPGPAGEPRNLLTKQTALSSQMASVYTPGTNSPSSCPAHSPASSSHKRAVPKGQQCWDGTEPAEPAGRYRGQGSVWRGCQAWLQSGVSGLRFGVQGMGEAVVLSQPGRAQGARKGVTAASPRGILCVQGSAQSTGSSPVGVEVSHS